MKSEMKIKQWLLVLLCALMAAGVLTGIAAAAEPTGECTNLSTEGIEYFQPVSTNAKDSNEWRRDLQVMAITKGSDTTAYPIGKAGEVIAMELEVVNSGTRYQCTEIVPTADPKQFSCNSVPANAVISGVYFRFEPVVSPDTDVSFIVSSILNPADLLKTDAKVKYPPYPCARNLLVKDFYPESGETLVWNTSKDCTEHKTWLNFVEQKPQFALVNIIPTDTLDEDRFHLEVTPKMPFSYSIFLEFEDSKDPSETVEVEYDWNEVTGTTSVNLSGSMPAQDELPLTLKGGKLVIVGTTHKDLWGNDDYPTGADFNIKFWYENKEGTLGYQNSVFHFERNLSMQFAPYCDQDAAKVPQTGVATALYDPCQASNQIFTVDLRDKDGKGIIIPEVQEPSQCTDPNDITDCSTYACDNVDYCTDVISVNPPIINYHWSHVIPDPSNYHFVTRRCLDSTCSAHTKTGSYPYSITVSDGLNKSKTYQAFDSDVTTFSMSLYDYYDGVSIEHPMAITGVRFVAEQPGTYMILGFLPRDYIKKGDLEHYAVKFFVTVNKTNQLSTCSTLANNGYFKALWNDCLASGETQLMRFEHIPGKEEAWMRNTSAHGIHFPYV
ncbi:MAG: hypothetical protein IKP86_01040, partial [Anaerolineaceae bacterium]|nr:hypothetical protein [Anaerolineaceae bacterium]